MVWRVRARRATSTRKGVRGGGGKASGKGIGANSTRYLKTKVRPKRKHSNENGSKQKRWERHGGGTARSPNWYEKARAFIGDRMNRMKANDGSALSAYWCRIGDRGMRIAMDNECSAQEQSRDRRQRARRREITKMLWWYITESSFRRGSKSKSGKQMKHGSVLSFDMKSGK